MDDGRIRGPNVYECDIRFGADFVASAAAKELIILHHSPSISNEYGIEGDVSTIRGGLSLFSSPVNA